MVMQGDIIKLNFSPQKGHEQAGFRPAVIVSRQLYTRQCGLYLLCPITNTGRDHPLRVKLDNRTRTTGVIMCEQVRAMDLGARIYQVIERLPDDLLWTVTDIVKAIVDMD